MIPEHLSLVCHADWSVSPHKRWYALAQRQADGSFLAYAPKKVPLENSSKKGCNKSSLVADLRQNQPAGGAILAGFDFPIGLPVAYARQAGNDDFLSFLPRLGKGKWADFINVAENPDQINLYRPFYPAKPGQARQAHLTEGLRLSTLDLRRACERRTENRRAAAPLFWTMGAQQVGKAALHGWKSELQPAIEQVDTAIWPFSGPLINLIQPGKFVIVETYPAEFYKRLKIDFKTARAPGSQGGGKRSQDSRTANAQMIIAKAEEAGIQISKQLKTDLNAGFGTSATGEDQFDTAVGLIGMLLTLQCWSDSAELLWDKPESLEQRTIEGWIFGQKENFIA